MVSRKYVLELAARLLDEASDAFSNNGCNDYELPFDFNSLALLKEIEDDEEYYEERKNDMGDKSDIFFCDFALMDYCSKYLKTLALGE